MTDAQITGLVEAELLKPTLAVTQQYLDIHQPVYKADRPVIANIIRDPLPGVAAAFLPVLNHRFYFTIYVDTVSHKVTSFTTEPYCSVTFLATSESLTRDQLVAMTVLTPAGSWSKGDRMRHGKSSYTFSAIELANENKPDFFENKIDQLLTLLEKDGPGILHLTRNADTGIVVAMEFHQGNGMIGGPSLHPSLVRRMNELNLGINFDLYVSGEEFL
jgi:hypothetical protein